MRVDKLKQAVRQIYDTKETEILCSECFDQLSEYVDREIAHESVEQQMPEIKYHLEQCRVCFEEYETLRDLVRLETQGQVPSIDELKKSL